MNAVYSGKSGKGSHGAAETGSGVTRSLKSRACAACLAVGAGQALAAPAAGHGWRVTEVFGTGADNFFADASPSAASALAVPGAGSAWSIWQQCTWPCSGTPVTVVRHWNGHGWTQVAASALRGLSPGLVAASSAKDAWLIQDSPAAALHWNGTAWTRRSVPNWLVYANGAGETDVVPADFGPGNLWLFSIGNYPGQTAAYAARYENGRWVKVSLPAVPVAVAPVSARDIWAVGTTLGKHSRTVLMHWTGRHWSTSSFPAHGVSPNLGGFTATGPAICGLACSR
jgi:hypothetical protein